MVLLLMWMLILGDGCQMWSCVALQGQTRFQSNRSCYVDVDMDNVVVLMLYMVLFV